MHMQRKYFALRWFWLSFILCAQHGFRLFHVCFLPSCIFFALKRRSLGGFLYRSLSLAMSNDPRALKRKWAKREGTYKWLANERKGIHRQFENSQWLLAKAEGFLEDARKKVQRNDKQRSNIRQREFKTNIRQREVERYEALLNHIKSEKKIRRLNDNGVLIRDEKPDFWLTSDQRKWNVVLEGICSFPSTTSALPAYRGEGREQAASSASGEGGEQAAASHHRGDQAAASDGGEGGEQAAASGEDGEPSAASQRVAATIGVARTLLGVKAKAQPASIKTHNGAAEVELVVPCTDEGLAIGEFVAAAKQQAAEVVEPSAMKAIHLRIRELKTAHEEN